MTLVQIESVEPPLDDPVLLTLAARLLTRIEAMGLLPHSKPIRALDREALQKALGLLRKTGIGQLPSLATLTSGMTKERLRQTLERLSESLEESPVPDYEWQGVLPVLGEDLLGSLLGVSGSSLQRYKSGDRTTPDHIAARLHFLALVIADLAGAYNSIGIRNWFRRTRSQLDGASPSKALSKSWTPDDEGPVRVRRLAESLTFSPVT